jgi:hypothetical protein
VPEDLVTDLGSDPIAIGWAEVGLVPIEYVLQRVPDALLEDLHRSLVVQLRAKDLLKLTVHPAADVGQWSRHPRHRRGRRPTPFGRGGRESL